MNQAEKATAKAHLDAEQKALKDLEKAYKDAKKDVQERLKALNARTDMQNLQTIVHQRKYQEALLKQIDSTLNDLQTHTYKTANEFFQSSYQNGWIGSMYELQAQGIPLTIPVSRKKMMVAIQTDSKLSKDYYLKQGLTVQNIRTLKKQIAMEATRGIATGKSWLEVANSLTIQRCFSISLSDAMRICRTEGNRINQQARLDAGDESIKRGCDLLKQWDSTMDDRTRPWHREADGQIVEWEEDFTVMGEKMKAPSIGGSAKNVINCRCQLLKRPRWALGEEELERLKERAKYFGLDKTESFEEYKKKFLTIPVNKQGTVESVDEMFGRLEKLEDQRKDADRRLDDLKFQEKSGDYFEKRKEDLNQLYSNVSDLTEKDIEELQELSKHADEYRKGYEDLQRQLSDMRRQRPKYEDFASEDLYEKAFEEHLQKRNDLRDERDRLMTLFNDASMADSKLYRYNEYTNRLNRLKEHYKTHLELLTEIDNLTKDRDNLSKMIIDLNDLIKKHPDRIDVHCKKWLKGFADQNVAFKPVSKHVKELTQQEIIDVLAGDDRTDGSCASVGFAYIGQKCGFDVRDFRGGSSMKTFRNWNSLGEMIQMDGLKILKAKGASSITVGKRLLKQCEIGKEYYLVAGRHASIVRKTVDGYEYLELQSDSDRGWTKFSNKLDYTLNWRFGCTRESNMFHEMYDFMIDLDDSEFNENDIQKMLGYINTSKADEQKGAGGSIK